jgi:hypothetical protein
MAECLRKSGCFAVSSESQLLISETQQGYGESIVKEENK